MGILQGYLENCKADHEKKERAKHRELMKAKMSDIHEYHASSSDEGSRGKTEEMLLHNQTNFTTIGKYKKGVAKLITLLQKESVFKEMSQDKKFECQKNLFKILNLFDSHGSDLSDDTKIISENEEEEEQAQMGNNSEID